MDIVYLIEGIENFGKLQIELRVIYRQNGSSKLNILVSHAT